MIKALYKIFLISSFVLFCSVMYGQYNENEIKSAYIKTFLANIEWNKPIDTLHVTVLDRDSSLYLTLKRFRKILLYKGERVKITYCDEYRKVKDPDLLYVAGYFNKSLPRIFNEVKGKDILLVSEEAKNRSYSMIDIFVDETKLVYRINKTNLDEGKFKVGDELIIFGGTASVFNALYIKKQNELVSFSKELKAMEKELEQKQQQMTAKEEEISLLANQKDSLSADVSGKEDELLVLQDEIVVQKKQLALKSRNMQLVAQMLDDKTQDLLTKEESIGARNKMLDSLSLVIEKNKQLIKEQEGVLQHKDEKLDKQEKNLFLLMIISVSFLLAVVVVVIAFQNKRKQAVLLESKVKARTAELEDMNTRFLSLFENSPVALWEEDISALLTYLKSLEKPAEECIEYLRNNPFILSEKLELLKIIRINNECLNLHNAKSKEELLADFGKTFNDNSFAAFLGGLHEIIKGGSSYVVETEVCTLDGGVRDVIIRWNIVGQESDERILVSISDITEQKQIEKELEKSKSTLEVKVHQRTEELMSANEELLATNDELYVKNNQLEQKNIELHDHQNEINQLNEELMQTNEELISTNEAVVLQKEALEEALVKLKSAQMQLVQSEKMASLGVLTAGVAHEINNPVNYISSGLIGLRSSIDMFVEVFDEYKKLKEGYSKEQVDTIIDLEEEVDIDFVVESLPRMIKNIGVGVERTVQIVNSLRVFSRSSEDQFTYTNIHEGIDSTLTILYNQYKNKAEVVKKYSSLPMINCLPGKINQVFMNILTNAVHAISEGGLITIITEPSADKEKVYITIRDNGTGIPEDAFQKIFDPFYTTKAVGEGTGLGLSISYSIIKEHNGDIHVNSELGKGTEFLITLPVDAEK